MYKGVETAMFNDSVINEGRTSVHSVFAGWIMHEDDAVMTMVIDVVRMRNKYQRLKCINVWPSSPEA
jgi:hypothetical protein